MIEDNSKNLNLVDLKDYAKFLLNNCLKEVTAENIKLAKENKLSLLRAFSHLTEQELFNYSHESLKSFLVSILEDNIIETTRETLQKWAKNELENIRTNKVNISDIVLSHSIRKQVLLKFLSEFTHDPQKIIAVAIATEKLYVKLGELTLSAYVEVHEEALKDANYSLKEYQEELQAANEELRESHEELQAINLKLKREVATRVATEQALEKEHNYLKAILDHIKDGIVACDEHGTLSFFNKATREFHGISEQALSPEQWGPYYNLYHPDGKTPLIKEDIPLFKAYNGEPVENIEMVIAPVKGRKRTLLASGQQIITKDGKNMGAVVVMHDVTSLKKAQEKQQEANRLLYEKNQDLAAALEELQSAEEQLLKVNNELEIRVKARTEELAASEEELRQTLDQTVELNQAIIENTNLLHTVANASPVTLWMSDTKGSITYVNQTWIDWTGRAFEEHLGQGWGLSITPEDRVRAVEKLLSDLQARRFYHVDFRVQHKDGQLRWCVAEGVPRYLASGEFAGYAGSCIDITERKIAENTLKVKNEQLEKINNDLDNFIYTASHDLKAPISNIEGLMSTLVRYLPAKSMEAPVINKVISMISASVERFKKTINDLTELTKLQRDIEDDVVLINLSDMFKEVLLDMETLIQHSEARFDVNFDLCPSIRFSEKNMRSVMYNLISNAIKYHAPERKPMIRVKSEVAQEFCLLTVEDNGLGMDLSQESKIFTMFRRLHDHVEGSGVGLYIVKKIVENRGGKIKVKSKLGKGSTFTVYFRCEQTS